MSDDDKKTLGDVMNPLVRAIEERTTHITERTLFAVKVNGRVAHVCLRADQPDVAGMVLVDGTDVVKGIKGDAPSKCLPCHYCGGEHSGGHTHCAGNAKHKDTIDALKKRLGNVRQACTNAIEFADDLNPVDVKALCDMDEVRDDG